MKSIILKEQNLKKNQILKILSLVIFGIFLVNIKADPVNAAPYSETAEVNSNKPLGDTRLFEDTPLFESNNFRMAFVSSLLITATGILVGKGKSLKHHQSPSNSKQSNKNRAKKSHTVKTNARAIKATRSRASLSAIWPRQDSPAQYKKIYRHLQQLVLSSREIDENKTWIPDMWEIDLEIAVMILSNFPDRKDLVEKVLLHSDRLIEWQKTLSLAESISKTNKYIEETYNWAKDLQKWREQTAAA